MSDVVKLRVGNRKCAELTAIAKPPGIEDGAQASCRPILKTGAYYAEDVIWHSCEAHWPDAARG